MRSRLAIVLLLAVPACATAEMKQRCHPVAGLETPAFVCSVPDAPPPPPEPEPEPEPPPEEPPPPEPIKEKIEISDHVQFESDSDVLLEESKPILDEVAKVMEEHPELTKVQIEGHTDGQDSKKHNQKLSEKRAAAVKKYLVSKGIDPDRLTTKGFGEDVPVADNDTPEGRFENRRVEFRVIERTDQ